MLTALGPLGCVRSATNLKPMKVPNSEGALFGRIEVESNGEPVTRSCYLSLTDSKEHQKAYLSLDKSGWVFTSVERGPIEMTSRGSDVVGPTIVLPLVILAPSCDFRYLAWLLQGSLLALLAVFDLPADTRFKR
ncbi:MAG: hypothetical protein RJA70_1807 [Pseudomonadota bacterium]|jgi:hypothetical protein